MAPKSQAIVDNRSATEKRRETIAKKKLEEQAQLRQIEAAGKVDRTSKLTAMKEAPWKGAAPTGSLKRGALSGPSAASSVADVRGGKKARIVAGVRTSNPKPKPDMKRTAPTLKGGKDVAPSQGKASIPPKLKPSTRRPPVTINSDDDKEAEQPLAAKRVPRLRGLNPESEDDDEGYVAGGGEPDDDDDSDLDDGLDLDDGQDLQSLSRQELKAALRQERPQWNAPTESDDEDDNGADLPDPGFCELTTASELDPTAGDEDEDDEDQGNNGEDGDDEPEPGRRQKPQDGKRAADRRAEVPKFKTAAPDEEPSDGDDSGPEGGVEVDGYDSDPNEGWPEDAHYYLPGRGKRNVSIKAQPYMLRYIIRSAIRRVTGDAIALTAYPPSETATKYFRKTLRKCAVSLGATSYANRLSQDHYFGTVLGRLLSGRISTYRGGMKKVALSKVEGFYQLAGGADGKVQVSELLNQTSYIFPRRGELLVRTKPFFNLAIISTLREVYFIGTRGTLAEKHEDRFTSTSDNPFYEKRPEVPAPMAALAATCVHSALDGFASGTCQKTEFNDDLYEDVYHGHIKFLAEIHETNPEGYLKLMADLYSAASSAITRRTTAIANNAMALLDIANMEV